MARIVEYEAKGNLQPNSEGYSAYEQAARRTGPLAQQSASDIEKLGRMAAETGSISSKFAYEYDSPFVSLLDKATKAAAAPKENAGGFKTVGGNGTGGHGGAGRAADDRDANLAGQATKYSGPDITRAAAALAKQANAMLNPQATTGMPQGQDVENGVTVLRGGRDAPNVSDIENGVTVLRGGGGPAPVMPWNGAGPSATISGPPENSGPHFPIPSVIGTGEPEGPPQSAAPQYTDPNAGPSFGEQVGGWFGSMFSPSAPDPGPSATAPIQDNYGSPSPSPDAVQ